MARNDLTPRSFFQFPTTAFSSFPALWDEMGEKMNQWMGANRGITLSEDDKQIHVEAQLPGLKQEDIDVSIHQNTLIIRGEKQAEEEDKEKRYYRRAQRSFYYEVDLPTPVDENTAEANYQDGILTIHFQKTKQSNLKKISVNKNNKQQQIQKQPQSQASNKNNGNNENNAGKKQNNR